MIGTIIDQIKNKVLNLKYIERYGGLVIQVTEKFTDEDGVEKSITFPASVDNEGRPMYIPGDYYNLAPNDRYKSVAYWELRGDAVPFAPLRGNRNNWYGFRQTARMVVWLNLDLLGEVSPTNISDYLRVILMNTLTGKHSMNVDYISGVKMKVERDIQKSMSIFSDYSYSGDSELMMYPFDFFAVDFEVEWYIRKDCLPDEQDYDPHCDPHYDSKMYCRVKWEDVEDAPDFITVEEVEERLDEKVDKEEGKGLSTEDYTTEEKEKLGEIEEGAQVNVQSNWDEDDPNEDSFIQNKPENLSDFNPDITTDDVSEGDNNLYFTDDRVSNNSDVAANTAARHTHPNKALLDTYDQTNEDLTDAVVHKDLKNNPHEVTADQVGLGNVDNTSDVDKPVSNDQAAAIQEAEDNAKTYADQEIGSLTTDDVNEGDNNLYYTEQRVSSNADVSANTDARHTHPNKSLLDTYDQTNEDIESAVDHVDRKDNPHEVTKEQVGLSNVDNTSDIDKPVSTAQDAAIQAAEDNAKGYADNQIDALTTDDIDEGTVNKYYTEQRVSANTDVSANTAARHTHANKALLDTYDQTNEDLADAVVHKDLKNNPHEVTADQVIGLQSFLTLQSFYNTKGYCYLDQKFRYTGGDQIFEIDFDIFEITDVFINGEKTLDFTFRHNEVEVLESLDQDDIIEVKYSHYCTFDKVYGIRRDKNIASPDWERIGKDMTLHATLPVQSQLKRCIVNDAGEIVYYLHDDDSAKKADGTDAVLDGTDGQYMRITPRHFQRFDEIDGVQYVWISTDPFPGSFMMEEMYASVAESTVYRPTNTLASVVSMDPDYRGGNNNASLDDDPNSQLGMPASAISRTNFVTYAQKRGEGWSCAEYEWRRTEAWLISIEFATNYHQRSFDDDLTSEGYKQGGLGDGPTTINYSEWGDFNSRYPIIPIGATLELGNRSGEIEYVLNDFPEEGETRTIMVNSYRGIQNPYGHIYEWTNGVNFRATEEGTKREIFKAVGDANSSSNYDGYKKIGEMPSSNGYITQIVFGPEGDILPIEASGGSSTTYFTDYYYMSASDGIRGLNCSGRANHGGPAGSFFAYSDRAPSSTNSHRGSRLCFFKKLKNA